MVLLQLILVYEDGKTGIEFGFLIFNFSQLHSLFTGFFSIQSNATANYFTYIQPYMFNSISWCHFEGLYKKTAD
jgi:hypothetical protein